MDARLGISHSSLKMWTVFVFVSFCTLQVTSLQHPARLPTSAFKIPLQKQEVPVMNGNRQVATKSAYYGIVQIGLPEPQRFTMVFDTGSGHLLVPSSACKDESCLLHARYNKSLSTTAVGVNHDGQKVPDDVVDRDEVALAYGTGEVLGRFYRDSVCLGGSGDNESVIFSEANATRGKLQHLNCARVRVITATEMTAEPFSHFMFDGVLGLGLQSLALDPEFHFFSQLVKRSRAIRHPLEPTFSFFISKSKSIPSELFFGGHDPDRMHGELVFFPVLDPEQGHWKVQIHSMRVGNETIEACSTGRCSAIVDTGTSLLGVPKDIVNAVMWKSMRDVTSEEMSRDSPDCRNVPGPTMSFDLGGFAVNLEAEDYSRPAPQEIADLNISNSTHVCRASLLPIDMPALGDLMFLWGEPILRKYYTSYDVDTQRVGFALSRQPDEASGQGLKEVAINI